MYLLSTCLYREAAGVSPVTLWMRMKVKLTAKSFMNLIFKYQQIIMSDIYIRPTHCCFHYCFYIYSTFREINLEYVF